MTPVSCRLKRRWVTALVVIVAASTVADPAKAGHYVQRHYVLRHYVLRAQAVLPRVVVLATGGTIASRFDPAIGALAPAATGADLVRAVPGLDKIARVDVEQIANIGSYDMTPTSGCVSRGERTNCSRQTTSLVSW